MNDQVKRIPEKLQRILEFFSGMDRNERIQSLIDMGNSFKPVPTEIAVSPYPKTALVPNCESQAYVFSLPNEDDTLKFYFAVENPQGISAKAAAVILDKGFSGAPLDLVLNVPGDILYDIFGRELSMGKNMGLTGMVDMCKLETKKFQLNKSR